MKNIFVAVLIFLNTVTLLADELTFRFIEASNDCRNASGKGGLNKNHLGECGYLERETFMPEPGEKLDLSNKVFSGSHWSQISMGFVDFSQSNLKYIFVSQSDLWEPKFIAANLERSTFKNNLFVKAHFSGANMRFCRARHTNFTRADFSKADLTAAQLDGSDLLEANFRDAKLTVTNLRRTDLSGADLTGVTDWQTTMFDGATFTRATRLPFDEVTAKQKNMILLD